MIFSVLSPPLYQLFCLLRCMCITVGPVLCRYCWVLHLVYVCCSFLTYLKTIDVIKKILILNAMQLSFCQYYEAFFELDDSNSVFSTSQFTFHLNLVTLHLHLVVIFQDKRYMITTGLLTQVNIF
jgi:hypothetical protein